MPTKKIYSNTIAQIGSKLITAVISIGLIKILTEYLGVAEYGIYSKIYNFLSIFAVIADLGLYTITVRELAENESHPEKMQKIANNVLTLRTLMGVGIIFLSIGIAFFLPGYDSHVEVIGVGIVAVFTLFGLINSSLMSYLQATLRTELTLISTTSGKLLTFLLILALYLTISIFPLDQNERLIAIFITGLLGNTLMTVLTYWHTRKYIHIRFEWDMDYIRHILRISLPYGIALFLSVIFFKVDVILLSILESEKTADISVALYSVPMKIIEVGMMYGTIFLNSLLPILTNAIKEKNTEKTHLLTTRGFEILLFFGIGISGALYAFADEILRIIASTEYLSNSLLPYTSADAMRIVTWIFLVYFISSLSTYILIAKGAQKRMMYINAFIAVFNTIGNIIVIPRYSFIGSAYITLFSQILLLFLTTYQVRDTLDLRKICPYSLIGILGISLAIAFHMFFPIGAHFGFLLGFCLDLGLFSSIYLLIFWSYFFIRKQKNK